MKTKLLLLAAILFGLMSQAQVVHLTGAGVGGWNNPPLAQNLMSTTDNINYTLSNIQITGSGGSAEFKFMIDNSHQIQNPFHDSKFKSNSKPNL